MNTRELRIVLAGFGGQGVLFAGKVIASAGLIEDRELSWLPSYGPEMRGGTANCSVCLSDEAIGSPLVLTPNVLIAMNQPSFDKFIDAVEPGGLVIVDSGLVPEIKQRQDVTICALPAQKLAEDAEMKGLGNIVLVGKLFEQTGFCSRQTLDGAIDHCVPARKQAMVALNKKALEIGMNS